MEWQKIGDGHYIAEAGRKTFVLTTEHSNHGGWSLLIREPGKREVSIRTGTTDLEIAQRVAMSRR